MGYGTRNTINDFISDESDGASFMGSIISKIRRRKTKKVRRKTRAKTHRRKHRKTSKRARRTRKVRRSGKTIHRTKKGQPYIILANGRARFIKRKR